MGITLTFESYEEMTAYARQLLGAMPTTIKTEDTVQELTQVQQSATAYQQPVQALPIQQTPINAVPFNQQPVSGIPTQPEAPTYQAPVQTTQQSYTKDDLANAAITLMDAGRQSDLLNLLAQFGVEALPNLAPEHYGAFATALRGLGAQI